MRGAPTNRNKARPMALASAATLALLCGALLAGCLGPPQVTAQQAHAFTNPIAQGNDPDSRLVFAAGLEARVNNEILRGMLQESGFEEFGFDDLDEAETGISLWERIQEDAEPGDGRAELWVLHYVSGDGEREHVYLVDRHENVLHEEERDVSEPGQGVGDYRIDSDEAMQNAKRSSVDFRATLDASNLIVGAGLLVDPGHDGPVWTISAMGGGTQGFRGAFVQLDAMTGDVIHSESESFDL